MRSKQLARLMAAAVLVATAASDVRTQAPSPPAPAAGPTFEVVSIKRNTADRVNSSINPRPDGGLTIVSLPVATLVARAYPPAVPIDMVGLPGWATSERYDVSATSPLPNPTPDQRIAMLRAMLADRFKLAVHFETREQPVYDLVLARRDGTLGSGLTPIETDCAARIAAEQAAAEAARNAGVPPPRPPSQDFNAPPPPCSLRILDAASRDRQGDRQGRLGSLMEGETTMANLAMALRLSAGRLVVDKTGLSSSYRVTMNFDGAMLRRGPDVAAPTPDAPPSVFTALPEQLGLKLEASRAPRETLIVDRLERPTEN